MVIKKESLVRTCTVKGDKMNDILQKNTINVF